MVLRELKRRLAESSDDRHRAGLREHWCEVPVTAIEAAAPRTRVVIGGEVQGVVVVPVAGAPSLEVVLHDGSGEAVAIFTGRRRIGGMSPGRRLTLDGVGRRVDGRLVFMNPAYTLLA